MRTSRKRFLATALAAGVGRAALSAAGGALGAGVGVEGPAQEPAEAATLPKSIAAARELALTMRGFDPTLTDKELQDIAKGIEGGWKTGRNLHKGLSNGDPPSPAFETGE